MSERGVILVDNVLWSGRIIDVGDNDANTVALRAFNDEVAARSDCEAVMLTIGDGLTFIRRTTSPAIS
jgi:caffeoyl-CoA O-methyltransferase